MNDIFVLPKDIDNLEELDHWMLAYKYLTLRQRRLSNDASIELYGKSNDERYVAMRNQFLNPPNKIVKEDADITSVASTTAVTANNDIISLGDNWEDKLIKASNAESMGMLIMIDTSSSKKIQEYGAEEIAKLNDKWAQLQLIPSNKRVLSDSTAVSIFGLNNYNLYSKITNFVSTKIDHLNASDDTNTVQVDYRRSIDLDHDTIADIVKEQLDLQDKYEIYGLLEYVMKHPDTINNTKETEDNTNIMPFFTPDEMEKFGVFSGEINLYSPKSDNDLVGNLTVNEWFQKYKDTCGTEIAESYQWSKTLKRLYFDYDKILESGDYDKIAARKQSILELGWNPEINYSDQAALAAANRHTEPAIKFADLYIFYQNYKQAPPSEIQYNKEQIVPLFIIQNGSDMISSTIEFKLSIDYYFNHIYNFVIDNNGRVHLDTSDSITDYSYATVNCIFLTPDQASRIQAILNRDNIQVATDLQKYNLTKIFDILKSSDTINTYKIASLFVYSLLKMLNIDTTNVLSDHPVVYRLFIGKMEEFSRDAIVALINDTIPKMYETEVENQPRDITLKEAMIGGCKVSELRYIAKRNKLNELYSILTPTPIFVTEAVRGVDADDKHIIIKTVEDVNTEFFKCHRNLESYAKANNYEGMKDELCKLKYLDNFSVKHMKNKQDKHYKEYADAHARITNDFNKYLKIVTDHEPDFNFSEYYKNSDWYDGDVKVSKSFLEWLIEILNKFLKKS